MKQERGRLRERLPFRIPGGGGRRGGRGCLVERNGMPPSYVSLRPTAPGAGCLGFPAGNPLPDQSLVPLKSRPSLLSWKTCRFSAMADFPVSRRVLRAKVVSGTVREPSAPSPPLRVPFRPRLARLHADFQSARGRRSNRRFAAAPPAGLGKRSFGQKVIAGPPS